MTIFTTWQEIAGLTAQQIATLQGHSARCGEATLQSMAQSYAKANALQVTYADVPAPEGAVTVDEWEDGRDDHGPVRTFTGGSWKVPVAEGDPWIVLTAATITVLISGTQRSNGTVHRWVQIDFAGTGGNIDLYDLPTTTARMLSESLAAAVAECERMNIADGGIPSSHPMFSAVER